MRKIERSNGNACIILKGASLSVIPILVHLEDCPGVEVIAKKSWLLTDDFEAYFSYKGFLFVVETPFVEIEISPVNKAPEKIRNEIFSHVEKFEWVSPIKVMIGICRYFLLPFNPRI